MEEIGKLSKIAKQLYLSGLNKEARDLFFTAVKLSHSENPLVKVLGHFGFEPSEVFEYGDDDKVDEVHPSTQSVHRDKGDEVQEIWMEYNPETQKMQYGYMHEGGEYGHKHAYYDNLEDLIAHIAEEDESDDDGELHKEGWNGYGSPNDHPCQCGGECQCGGSCKDSFTKESSDKKTNKPLNKPFRTPGGPKKFTVYVKNNKGNIVKVNFGDPNMEIKRDDPGRRKNFRARHHCENATDPTKARTWSCRMWQKNKSVSDMTKDKKKK